MMEKKEPEKRVKKKKLTKEQRIRKLVLTLAVIIGVFVTAITTAYRKTRQEERKKNMVRDQLEEYYSKGDYKALTDYYYEQRPDVNDSKYAKYKSISGLYDEYAVVIGYLEDSYVKLTDEFDGNDDIRWDLEQAFRVILLCDISKEDGYPHDVEKGVTDIRKMTTDYLTEKLLLTSDEIEAIADQNLKAISREDTEKVNEVIDELAIEAMSRVSQ